MRNTRARREGGKRVKEMNGVTAGAGKRERRKKATERQMKERTPPLLLTESEK